MVLGNDLLEEGEPEETPQRDIHAKIFFEERDDGKYLYLGSLNASANAFYHNVEFMLKLRYRHITLRLQLRSPIWFGRAKPV